MVLDIVSNVFADYGWCLLALTGICAYLYKRFTPQLQEYMHQRAEAEYTAKYHKNPDLFAQRMSEQQSYIQRLQDEYEKETELHQQKMKEKEERKKQELLAKFETASGSGKRLGEATSAQKSFKPEYNPLMGSHSKGYRPPKKTCGGGGCGR